MKAPRLLVTTALEETCLEGRDLLLLGEWCRRYSRRSFWEGRSHEVLPFHWNTPGKRHRDYLYLEDLFERTMLALAQDLDVCHGVTRPVRYWRIVLGTWLGLYVSALFDRWESTRLAVAREEPLETVALSPRGPSFPALGRNDEARRMNDDRHNHELYLDVIESLAPERIRVIEVDAGAAAAQYEPPARSMAPARRKLGRMWAGRASRWLAGLSAGGDVALVDTFLPLPALVRLSLLLRQVPRTYPELGTVHNSGSAGVASPFRERLLALAHARSSRNEGFEAFLWRRLGSDLARPYLEGFDDLQRRARDLKLRCRVIATANAHWHNELFKVWAAERVLEGARLVTAEHGGSFPGREYVFNAEEHMADVHTPTYLPHHPAHHQMPPTKYAGVRPGRGAGGTWLLMVPYEGPRYTIRAAAQPHASQTLDCFRDSVAFADVLPATVRAHLRVKLRGLDPAADWELRDRYTDRLGAAHVVDGMALDRAFSHARLVVCTYPQSTFTEAILSGRPTVMFFDPAVHELHPVADEVVTMLQRVGVIFSDPREAARQVVRVWGAPHRWWQAPDVQRATRAFLSATMNDVRAPLWRWAGFLRAQVREARLTGRPAATVTGGSAVVPGRPGAARR